MRKDWDSYFLDIARLTATRATCNKLMVGCVITKNNKIVSSGYNGSIHNHEHCIDVGCLLNEQGRCIRTLHAEQNAVLHADRELLKGSTAYVTHFPCENCMKTLNQVGVKRVVYEHEYKNERSLVFATGVELVHFKN